jgi:hypothetical protein
MGQLSGTPKTLFFGKNPKIFFFSNFFLKYFFFLIFFTVEVSHFWGTKNSKKIFFAKFLFFSKKIFFLQKQFGKKTFFTKTNWQIFF